MFKSISKAVNTLWHWWSWDQLAKMIVFIIVISAICSGSYLLYGHLFLPKTINGCYIKSFPDYTRVYRDINWQGDPDIKLCTDIECVSETMKSDICKPH